MNAKVLLTNLQVNEYLNSVLLSGKDYSDMFSLFQSLSYSDFKIAIFKLYNEEISLSEMANSEPINLDTNYIVRRLFIRNQIVSMTYQFYKNKDNIDKQLEIISYILSNSEKQYLKNNLSYLNLFGNTFDESKYWVLLKNFVRIENLNNNHAQIETNNISKFADDLNSEYDSDTNPLISIFGKLNKSILHN